MYFRKSILTFNILLFSLISVYFVINIISNYGFKHRFHIYSPQELRDNSNESLISDEISRYMTESTKSNEKVLLLNNETNVGKSFNQLLNVIRRRVETTDEYLKKLSKFKRTRSDSKLIYPNEMSEMTEISINHKSCSEQFGKDLLLVVLVFNRVDGFQRRQAIRETWGQQINDSNRSRLYFTVGLSRDVTVQPKLAEENERFGDILQFNYYEDYYNCTIKGLALLRWTAMSCPFVKFMLKVDDDSLILPQNLLDFCDKTQPNSMFGYLWRNPTVMRGQNKWGVSLEDYPASHYPDYIGGPYLIPGRYVLDLYETAVRKCLPALHFEDVYITGIVANQTGIERRKLDSLLCVWEYCPVMRLDFCYYKSYTILWQGFHDNELRKVWEIYQNGNVCPNKGGHKC